MPGKSSRSSGRSMGATETFKRRQRSLPVQIFATVVRWRWEIMATTGLVWSISVLNGWGLTGLQTAGVLAACAVACVAVGPVRRFIRNRLWCVITRHRVRTCLAQVRALNFSGASPWIVACYSTPVGESVWVGLRAGLSEEEISKRAEHLAAACWARNVTLLRSVSNGAFIRLDVERRDPLTKTAIKSPFLAKTKDVPSWDDFEDVSALSPPFVIDANGVEVEPVPVEEDTKGRKSRRRKTADSSVPVAVSSSGEDVSDYV
jgi:hypothetical protein